MPVPDIRRREECGVLGEGTATRSCANNPAEMVTYLVPRVRSHTARLKEASSLAFSLSFPCKDRTSKAEGCFPAGSCCLTGQKVK